jgi:hypothetical protein
MPMPWKLATALALLVLTPSGAAAQVPANPETEPNDTRAQAKANGPIGFDDLHRRYVGALTTENDGDVFMVYASRGPTQLSVALGNTTPQDCGHSIAAVLTDGRGNELTSTGSVDTDTTEEFRYTVKGPAQYYVWVRHDGYCLFGDEDYLSPTYSFLLSSNRALPRRNPLCSDARTRQTAAKRRLKKARKAYRRRHTVARRRAVRRAKANLRTARFRVSRRCS